MEQNKINEADLQTLRELLKSNTVEKIIREKSKEEVPLVPGVFFEKVPKWLFISKENFVNQYEKWSPSEKEQIDLLLTFMRSNYFIKGGMILNYSKNGYYTDLWISNNGVDYPFRIYAERGFIDFIAYYQLHYFKPDFTLAELYQEALKDD